MPVLAQRHYLVSWTREWDRLHEIGCGVWYREPVYNVTFSEHLPARPKLTRGTARCDHLSREYIRLESVLPEESLVNACIAHGDSQRPGAALRHCA